MKCKRRTFILCDLKPPYRMRFAIVFRAKKINLKTSVMYNDITYSIIQPPRSDQLPVASEMTEKQRRLSIPQYLSRSVLICVCASFEHITFFLEVYIACNDGRFPFAI